MKSTYLIVLIASFISTSAFAEVVCKDRGDGLQICHDIPSTDPQACSEASPLGNQLGVNENTPLPCDRNKTFQGSSKNDVAAIQKELNRQCRQKAKEYKRTVTRNLFKKGKLFQGLQALLKKKRYKLKNGKRDKSKVELSLDAKTLAGMNQQELNDHIMAMLEEQKPGIGQQVKEAMKDPEFRPGLHEEDTIVTNVIMQTDRNNACVVNVGEFPERTPAQAAECEFCEEKDVKSSFTNDCAYMVGKHLSEKEAQALLGLKSKNKQDYCQPSMEGVSNEMGQVDQMSQQLCDIAQKGLTPDFTIETSRNLYSDKTPQLAQKRGEFIQKYIQQKLKDCPSQPEWMTDPEIFSQKIKVSHPEYVGAKEGDYGPDPMATPAQQPQQIDNFIATLELEKKKLIEKSALADDEIKRFEEQKKELLTVTIPGIKKQYDALKTSSKKVKEVKDLMTISNELEAILNMVQQQYVKVDELERRISDSQKQMSSYKKKVMSQYSEAQILKRKEKLQTYYAEINQKGSVDRNHWDKELFNDFKMVRISGKAIEENELGIDPTLLTPEVKLALKSMVEVQSMTCVLDPMTTKRLSLEGVLKGVGKVGMALTLPVVAAAGGAVSLAAMPITTTASLLCSGCGKRGSVLPRWMLVGNLTQLNLSRSGRREAWDNTKGFVSSYVNLGGALKVKTKKHSTTHDNWEELSQDNEARKAGKE